MGTSVATPRISPHFAVVVGVVAVWIGVATIVLGATQQEARPQSSDAYGYAVFDQDTAECAYQFINISGTGIPLSLTPAGSDPAADEGAAVLTLAKPFEFYGEITTHLVVSANGYLAATATLGSEDGADFSNDCPLPAIPGNEHGTVARIHVYHADLSGAASGGSVNSEYFATCPRSSSALPDEACTVVRWRQWGFAFEPGVLDFQAVLYHSSSQVVLQVAANDSADNRATVGLQDRGARSAALFACNTAAVAPPGTAVCFFDPKHPAGGSVSDLTISKTDKADEVTQGELVAYSITVGNSGPSPVSGATVTDTFPAALEDCSWTCAPMPGSNCTAGPIAGDLNDGAVLLPVEGAVEYTVECSVAPSASGVLTNSASVSPPAATTDPDTGNNQATDTSTVIAVDEIFSDGFESGDTDAWS